MDYGLSNWIALLVAIVIALLGLLLAARGVDFGMELAGWRWRSEDVHVRPAAGEKNCRV
jgi:hypothetical protein